MSKLGQPTGRTPLRKLRKRYVTVTHRRVIDVT